MNGIDLKKYIDFLKEKKVYILIAAGILLLFVSFFNNRGKDTEISYQKIVTSEEYIADTEEKLKDVISEIIGSKDVKVMITLNTSIENIYADSTKTDTQVTENPGNNNLNKTEQSNKTEEEYIIVKDSDGNETALTVTQIMPQIRGVVIVCPGGNESVVRDVVKNAVVTVLDINSKKVCVVGGLN